MVNIRPAREAEFSQIKQIVRRELVNPFGLHRDRFLIAEDHVGNLLGCVQIKRHIGGAQELASLVVDRPWRRQGVASALIDAVQEGSQSPLWLTCRSRLRPFYTRFGFREIRDFMRMPWYFKLASVFGRVLRVTGRIEGYIAVMRWDDLSPISSQ